MTRRRSIERRFRHLRKVTRGGRKLWRGEVGLTDGTERRRFGGRAVGPALSPRELRYLASDRG